MGKVTPTDIVSHWNHMLPGLNQSSDEFYKTVQERIAAENLKEIKIERVTLSEGGIFSNRREYLQIRRDEHVFHVCAAPYGQNFFISWWLGTKESGIWAWIGKLPWIGWIATRFLKPITYFKMDTAGIFQTLVHGAITETLEEWVVSKGIRPLLSDERKPVMKDLFSQLRM
jgi:hypothetical protein